MAFELINTDNVTDAGALELDGARSVSTAAVGGTTYLFVASPFDDGVSVFAVGTDGTLTNAYNVTDLADLELDGATSVASAEIGGITYLFVTGQSDDGVSVFSVAEDGTLTNVDNVTDAGALELDGAHSVATATFGATTYLFVAGFGDDGVSVFSVGANGALAPVVNIDDTDDISYELAGAYSVTTAVVNSLTYLFVAGFDDDGVSVFRVSPDGTLTNVDNVTDGGGLELQGAIGTTTAVVGGTTYLFVAGTFDNGVSVFSVANDGTLTNVDNVTDAGALELKGATSVTTQVVDGITYLFVAGSFDDGISVFSVADNGTLTNVANVTDSGDLELEGAISVTTQVVDGITYLFVAGVDDNGVSVFRFGHNIIDETAAAVQVAENGTGPTDPIAKVDAADPVVFSIDGGADAALFTVDAATGEVSFIAAPDFEAPQDADGDNVYEVIIKGDDDIITETKAISIEVTNVGGLIVKGSSADETLTGAGEEDTLKGKKGEDKLKGLGGNDLLNGGKHKDKLIGGDGEDAFLFADKLKDEFADKIKDFEVGVDMIYLDNAIFTALDDGALKSKFFDTGKTADSGKDRILYQEDKGWLRYDADGKGGADAVKFARIGKNLDLSADDFLVV